jgi:hypothetical protein
MNTTGVVLTSFVISLFIIVAGILYSNPETRYPKGTYERSMEKLQKGTI